MPLLRKHSTVTGDTHALATGSSASDSDGDLGVQSQNVPNFAASITDEESTALASVVITPTSATNRVVIVASGMIFKGTAGTLTVRIKESTEILGTATSGTIAAGDIGGTVAIAILTNVSAEAHTYDVTLQSSTTNTYPGFASISGAPITLTGSQGVCTP